MGFFPKTRNIGEFARRKFTRSFHKTNRWLSSIIGGGELKHHRKNREPSAPART